MPRSSRGFSKNGSLSWHWKLIASLWIGLCLVASGTEAMSSAQLPPGYTETDIHELVKDRRLLAAIDAYAHDRLTMGQAMVLVAPPLLPARFKNNFVVYQRAIHEIAKRILDRRITVPAELHDEYPSIYSEPPPEIPAHLDTGARAYKFSTLEAMPAEVSPLAVRREQFNEDDIQELLKDPKILACIDAYGQQLMSFFEARQRMFGDLRYLPRNLSDMALLDLALEVIKRIRDGRIVAPPSLRDDYAFAYVPKPIKER